MKKVSILFVSLMILSLGLVSCSDGEDGLPGPNGSPGQPGANADKGAPGTDGTNGEDAIGYEELTQYGSVTVNLQGTRPDNIPFDDSVEFKFSNTEVIDGINVQDNLTEFSIVRFLSTPDNAYQNTHQTTKLDIANLGEANEVLDDFTFTIENLPIVGADNKYFVLNLAFIQNNPTDIIQNFAFDPVDNHLTYSYEFIVNALSNSSGFDLTVSGEVDVFLLDEL